MARADQICTTSAAVIEASTRAVTAARARLAKSRTLIDKIGQQLERSRLRPNSMFSTEVEIEALTRFRAMTARFLHKPSITTLLEDGLQALLLVTDAPFGNVQLLNRTTGMLNIVVHQGFHSDFLDFFAQVPARDSACGVALRSRRRVIVRNVVLDAAFTEESRRVMLRANACAVQSTPLVSTNGDVIGVVSTHYREPRVAQTRALRIVDLYARQLAALIESLSVTIRHASRGVGLSP